MRLHDTADKARRLQEGQMLCLAVYTASEYIWKEKIIQFNSAILFKTNLICLLRKWIF